MSGASQPAHGSGARHGRRARLAAGAAAALLATLAVGIAACGGDEGGGSRSTPAGQPKTGGTLRVGMRAGSGQFDPVTMAGAVGDVILVCQAQENLVMLAQDFSVQPWLAAAWDSPDGKTWRFELQSNVTFSNGEPFTAEDVVYSFERLRSKGSPMASVYANVDEVTAGDPTHVTFRLKKPDSEFPASLTDCRAKMFCKRVRDPMKELVGTGPFMLASYAAEDRAILVKNPAYWQKDENGDSLPYLDGVEFVYAPDTAGQIEGLRGGSLHWVGGLTAEQRQIVESAANLKVITAKTNSSSALQIRCDRGPGKSLLFRQALMAGTDRQAIVALVMPGVGDAGNGTLVDPAYGASYSEDQVAYDPHKAKRLLADAGFADGVKIRLVIQRTDPAPALATAWQAQMREIGVDVSLVEVTPDVFSAKKGTDNRDQADFSLVDWGTRATPITYFQLALISAAPWNSSRWSNADFDSLAAQIPQALGDAQRADLYRQAQTILQNQAPMITLLIKLGVAGEAANVEGVELDPEWARTRFTTAYFTE